MRSLLFVVTALAVIGLAFWAYHENYKTQSVVTYTEKLQSGITQARARLAVLKAEWAYLNRPDRLRELANINFDSLGLLALAPEQFGRIDQVSYPTEKVLIIENSVDVSTMEANQ